MLSEYRVRRMTELAIEFKLLFREINHSEWGTFEPLLSFDGTRWFRPGDRFGWGFTPFHVVARVFTDRVNDPTFKLWMGPERLNRLFAVLAEPDVPDDILPVSEERG
jgi:hypothetical protein